MALALTRTTYTASIDDSGAGTDGTIIDKAFVKDAVLDPVDVVFALVNTSVDDLGRLSVAPSTTLTIATGAVTVVGNRHSIDTEAAAASDDLDTLTAGTSVEDGHIVILKAENVARVVTVRHGAGNIRLQTGGYLALSSADQRLVLVKDGSSWYELNPNAGRSGTRGGGTTSSATPTPNADTTDLYSLTAQAAAAAFAAPTGTPVNGQKLLIRIKDNGTARALTWNAAYVAGGTALPSTTVISKILTIGFIYNTDNALNKWQCVGSQQET